MHSSCDSLFFPHLKSNQSNKVKTESNKTSALTIEDLNKALQDIYRRFEFIYNEKEAYRCLRRFERLRAKYALELEDNRGDQRVWTEQDVLLITYGDSIVKEGQQSHKLAILHDFLEHYLKETINSVHILPFFPFSSDTGFSVINYKKVRNDLGTWQDIEALASRYNLMADLVINHISSRSTWFRNFKKRKSPGKDYFVEVDPQSDLSEVTRPRSSPLLTEVDTDDGKRYVWTTFSQDQIDLDFSNPDVLIELIDIFLFYLSKGIKIIRMDAIAYLWKQIGSKSIHEPETHQIVKLFRDIVDYVNPSATLITETNVPFKENISYFGSGDEAHMVYQFSLPPLLLHAILTENVSYLREWAYNLPEPPEGCMYFNFTSSHDGIGVRPLEGLVPDKEFQQLIKGTKERGGYVSYKKNANGTESPYELNITYFDAFREPGDNNEKLQLRRYLCSQIIMMSLQGLPAFYIHNLTGTRNNHRGVIELQEKRVINRMQWDYDELKSSLKNENDTTHKVFYKLKELINIRKQHPAFSPRAGQDVLNNENDLFVFLRIAKDGSEKILVVSNLTRNQQKLEREEATPLADLESNVNELISGRTINQNQEIRLEPFQTLWLQL